MKKLTIEDVDLKGKRCFIRVDFNVPIDQFGNITDDTRIKAALPTINYAIDEGAKVILASHMGRPKGVVAPHLSMNLALKRLRRLLGKNVMMVEDCIGNDVKKGVDGMKPGDVLLLENLRFHKEEEKNDDTFSKKLAELADVYINDAFGTAHRAHASTYGITKHVPIAAAGFLMKKEIQYFEKAVSNPTRPFVAILGGSKASGKIGVLNNLADKVNKVIIGGGLSFTFLKALGYQVGGSMVEDNMLGEVNRIIQKLKDKGVKFYLPVDFVVAERMDMRAEAKIVPAQEIPNNWVALDIGPATSTLFAEALHNAKTIIWNGPMGVFEMDPFSRGTIAMVHAVANSFALTIVGGGDTDVAVHKAGESDKISYISTGGGAFLELLEGKALPGIEALTDKKE
ncbi:MAG: phosphoglycerate kinase [Nitrospinae bacterium RIFCSPLOWO2_02_FULL_39_110]|nr:MAG: phosphoglycerate kinase [Nitrospinae bacterium RIFCSPHIGHO2_02_39_11]OGV98731.1 MAG: phosphoglycerate kinase [Nitrospinae bacterium RIFCSPHIGHO2_12_FULL_39_42]OGW00160.1 MAG: phosphoglycerate kinase [Nitrospinae bacterium RIFCSPHIGHO2_02_FULL_39_82]OGW04328.1 MAG: phosphoglycerate kinase [Nitrospinae bacterium RIFCSPLOWO2_02_FULL_39_110]OGW07116.1 MAG: phosphoglycerate kinase [Nitrospinae bacterium RIFCSPLOWO2_02_39_17]OGW09477.1 MAG: phosphoglycerate kinase [Nitrospinae bacterium RIFC